MRPNRRTTWRALSVAVAAAACVALTGTTGDAAAAPSQPSATGGTLADEVRAMQATADRVGAELAAGAFAWEAGRAKLDVLLQRSLAAQRQVADHLQEARVAQERVNAVARRAYTHPTPESWAMAMSIDPNALTRSLENLKVLERIGATRQGAVELLVRQRADSAVRAARADRLRVQAQAEQDTLDAGLDTLRARATAALSELQATQDRLEQLRAQQRAEAAARSARQAISGTCSSSADGSYANGFLPAEMLCPLATAPGHQLAAQAAAAFDRLSAFHQQATGSLLCVTDSYRSYADQVAVFATKPSLAATPGRSQHGWGLAVDLCGGVERFGSSGFDWMTQNAAQFGFVHPAWAEPGGSKPEPWHWEFAG
jgi:D-alanyl-D-alanine carboxypeptidase